VIRAFKNGLAVFVSKFGLEGLVTFKRENRFDAEKYEIAVPTNPIDPDGPEVRIGVFDRVTVEITTEKVSFVHSRSFHAETLSYDLFPSV